MKKLTVNIIFLFAIIFNLPVFADKVVVNGAPITLTASINDDQVYTLPADYTVQSYNYVMLDGEQRICTQTTQPIFADLDVKVITVTQGTDQTSWYCYEYNTKYFQINP